MRGRAALSTVLLVVLLAAVGLGDGAIQPGQQPPERQKEMLVASELLKQRTQYWEA